MNTVAAFILIIATWQPSGPVYSMQEFSSETACKVAIDTVRHKVVPPNDMTVVMTCVPK